MMQHAKEDLTNNKIKVKTDKTLTSSSDHSQTSDQFASSRRRAHKYIIRRMTSFPVLRFVAMTEQTEVVERKRERFVSFPHLRFGLQCHAPHLQQFDVFL